MSRRAWIALIGGFVLLFLAGCGGGAYLLFQWWDWYPAAAQLPDAEKRARELGPPLVAADLAPKPPVKPGDNAAPAIRRMVAEFQKVPAWNKKVSDLEQAMRGKKFTEAAKMLAPFDGALNAAATAANKPRVDFHRDWDLGPNVLFPEYAYVKGAVKLLGVRSRLAAENGRTEQALNDLRLQRGLATLVGDEPTLIAMMIEIATKKLSLQTAERLAALWKGDDAKLAEIEKILSSHDPLPSFAHALRGEVFLGVATARNLQLFGSNSDGEAKKIDPRMLQREGMPRGRRQQAFMTRHLQIWNESWPHIIENENDPMAVSRELVRLSDKLERKRGISWTLSKIIYTNYSQASDAVVSIDASERVTLSLVKALRHRLKTGSYPAFVDEKDPFDGKPLRVKTDGEKIRIYSVGKNLTDEGGLTRSELPKNAKNKVADDVASYPPIERK